MASSPRYPAGACAGAAPDWLCDGKLQSITQLVLCDGNLAACLQTELTAAHNITRTFRVSAPRYPAGATTGAAPDLEAVALYATYTGRNVSPDAAGGCPRSPSADVSALRKRSARRGASLQRLMTGSPPLRLDYRSPRARLGILGSGRTCGRPCPRSQTAHPLGFGRSGGRRRLLRYRTDVE